MRVFVGAILGLMLSAQAMANDFFLMTPPTVGAPAQNGADATGSVSGGNLFATSSIDDAGTVVSMNLAFPAARGTRTIAAAGDCSAIAEAECIQAEVDVSGNKVWHQWTGGTLDTPPATSRAPGGMKTQALAAGHKYLQSASALNACTRSGTSATPCSGVNFNSDDFCAVCNQIRDRAYAKGWTYQWDVVESLGFNGTYTGAKCTQGPENTSSPGCDCAQDNTPCFTWETPELE